MKKLLVFLCAMALIFGVVGAANAYIFYQDRADWEAAVGGYIETSDYGTPGYPGIEPLTAGTGIDVGYGETLSFDIGLSIYKVPVSWLTWSGGYTGEVLFTQGAAALTGSFVPGILDGFGFEAEPNPFAVYDISLVLADGTLTQPVDGYGGAAFFGWVMGISDSPVVSMGISSDIDFAVGRFVASGVGVPEPATMLLLGSGLIGLAGLGRKKFLKKA